MEQDTSTSDTQAEINFDGLRNAISPINLMFDGRLYKDVKGLVAHITQAMKMVTRERPDYQAALVEINLLESSFNSATMSWEQKLTGEIQRLKGSVETAGQTSLGSTKKISKYKEELTRGQATTRSIPIRIAQVRHQLIHAIGNSPHRASFDLATQSKSRLAEKSDEFPVLYKNAAAQVLRKAGQRGGENFVETALKVFKNLSKPMVELQSEEEIHGGRLYYLQQSVADNDPKSQFVVVNGINTAGKAYALQSIFLDAQHTFEIEFEDFDQREVFAFVPLEDMDVILQLLRAKFKSDDFRETFSLYAAIRRKAMENKREEKFNPRQLEIHQYLTDLIFGFVGISFTSHASEVRLTEHINTAIQSRWV